MEEKLKRPEGWGWLSNSPKWHYFVDGRSLCNKWMYLGREDLDTDGDDHPDYCKACQQQKIRLDRALVDGQGGT